MKSTYDRLLLLLLLHAQLFHQCGILILCKFGSKKQVEERVSPDSSSRNIIFVLQIFMRLNNFQVRTVNFGFILWMLHSAWLLPIDCE